MPPAPKLFGPDRNYERWRWQIFGITWLAYAGFYLTRKSFSVAKIDLEKPGVMGLTKPEMSWIDGGFLTAYAIGMVLCGICGDRYGTRKVVLIGMIGSVFAAVAMGAATSFMLLGTCFILQGLFQSTGWAPLAKNIANFFSRSERGVVMGAWCTNYAFGGLVASIFAGFIGQHYGWRCAFFVPAAALGLIAVLFFFFQRNRPEDVGLAPIESYHGEPRDEPRVTADGAAAATGSWATILEVIRNPMVLLLAAIYFCLKPARYAILFWGPKYVNDKLGSGMAESGFLSAMFELAGPFSVVMAGLVSDKVFGSRRMPVSVICLFLLSGLLFVLDDLPNNRWMMGASLFLIGLLTYAPDSLVSGTACVDFGTKRGASTASGLVNGAGSIGAIVGGTIPGFFHEKWGWSGVFTFLAAAVLLAALLLLPKWNAVPKGAQT
jgi:OPA family sugar phosphate sensor protein UhpC-like MFS transporter